MKKNVNNSFSKWKSVIMTIAIGLILIFFVFYGIHTFYKEPKFDDYCKDIQPEIKTDTCGNESYNVPQKVPYVPYNNCYCEQDCSSGICKQTSKCWKTNPEYAKCSTNFDEKMKNYEKNFFFISVIIGAIILIIGYMLGNSSVSIGMMWGSLVIIFIGTIRYWRDLGDILRFIVLGAILIILIFLSYKKFNK